MAGGGGEVSNDNPLPLNVVPLIDVIFCLLLFFMCSFHFKTLEGKMEAWLPTDKGEGPPKPNQSALSEIRIVLDWDATQSRTSRKFGRTEYQEDEQLANTMKAEFDRHTAANELNTPVIIQASGLVPWAEVIKVMDLAKQRNLPKIEFSLAKSEFVIPDQR